MTGAQQEPRTETYKEVCSARGLTATDYSWQFFMNQSSRRETSLAYFHFIQSGG